MSSFISKASTEIATNNADADADAASMYSVISSTTTLKGSEYPRKRKWFYRGSKSSEPKYVRKSDKTYAELALHNEEIATYLSLR